MALRTALDAVSQDLRYSARTLRKSPGFTTATILTLALGIGANSAIFSIVDGVLLKPVPYPRSAQLVDVYARDPNGQRNYVSQPDLDDWRANSHSFSGLASWVPQSVNLTGLDQPERITGVFVSSNFLPTLGVAPALGRGFAPGEDRSGGARVALISDRLWHTRFGGDAAVVGKSVQFNGEPYAIVGILPHSFVFPFADADVFLPAFKYPNYSLDRGQPNCAVVGRLREGASVQAAQSEMNALMSRLARSYPVSNKGRSAEVVPLKEDVVSDLRPSVIALAGAVVFVLLIACANVAGLLIARMIAREKDRAVRIALGAGRARLVSHALAEAGILAVAGGGLGLLLGIWSVPAMAAAVAEYLPPTITIALDRDAVLFTLAISLLSALFVAAIPLWQSSRADLLRSSRGAGSSAGKNRSRAVLVTAEIALAVVLLVGAGLMIKSFSELGRTRPGFETHNLLTLAYRVPRTKYPNSAQQNQFHREVVASIKAVPGVLSATSVRAVPLGGNGNNAGFWRADRPEPTAAERPSGLLNFADPDFFVTMRIPLLQGRAFSEHDQPGSRYVVIVNQTLARRFFADRNPIGQLLHLQANGQTAEIVGVVGDIKQFTLKDPPEPQIYGALAQNPFIFTSLAVRTSGDPLKMVNQIRKAIWRVDPDQPVWSIHSFDEIVTIQSRVRQLITSTLAAYAGIALILACIGIFGVISYAVSQRTAEIGVRMALGAQPSDVARLILRQGLAMTAIGCTAGTGGAMWLSRYLRTQLYAVSPLDPGVYVIVAALLTAVAIAACLAPARRAAKIDPTSALRSE